MKASRVKVGRKYGDAISGWERIRRAQVWWVYLQARAERLLGRDLCDCGHPSGSHVGIARHSNGQVRRFPTACTHASCWCTEYHAADVLCPVSGSVCKARPACIAAGDNHCVLKD